MSGSLLSGAWTYRLVSPYPDPLPSPSLPRSASGSEGGRTMLVMALVTAWVWRSRPMTMPSPVCWPIFMKTRDGEEIPSRFLAPLTASPTTPFAALMRFPAMLFTPLIIPRMRSMPAPRRRLPRLPSPDLIFPGSARTCPSSVPILLTTPLTKAWNALIAICFAALKPDWMVLRIELTRDMIELNRFAKKLTTRLTRFEIALTAADRALLNPERTLEAMFETKETMRQTRSENTLAPRLASPEIALIAAGFAALKPDRMVVRIEVTRDMIELNRFAKKLTTRLTRVEIALTAADRALLNPERTLEAMFETKETMRPTRFEKKLTTPLTRFEIAVTAQVRALLKPVRMPLAMLVTKPMIDVRSCVPRETAALISAPSMLAMPWIRPRM